MNATDYLLWGWVTHLIVDWFFQNEWQAVNKTSLTHPAAYVHSGLHLLGLLCVFPWWMALLIAVSHLVIDTRRPLQHWARLMRQTSDPSNPVTLHLAFWRDQVAHVAVLALAAWVITR